MVTERVDDRGLPAYDAQLSAFHRAFEPELAALVAALPITPAMHVLDLACGDGFYTRRIADRLTDGGRAVGVDVNPAYLEVARHAAGSAPVELVVAAFDQLPFPDHSFDFVWCAQSLYSLPDPVVVLEHVKRVLRPGGIVAVLENDTMHQVFLPWPVSLEVPLRAAELRALAAETRNWNKFYVGRRLPSVFAAAGLEPLGARTIAIDRQAPFDDATRTLLQSYLDETLERAAPHLDPMHAAKLTALADPTSPQYLLAQPHLALTWLNVLALARCVTC
jgi:ubiquinone/menaquinone biosynthesis C-methylase UbiE